MVPKLACARMPRPVCEKESSAVNFLYILVSVPIDENGTTVDRAVCVLVYVGLRNIGRRLSIIYVNTSQRDLPLSPSE